MAQKVGITLRNGKVIRVHERIAELLIQRKRAVMLVEDAPAKPKRRYRRRDLEAEHTKDVTSEAE